MNLLTKYLHFLNESKRIYWLNNSIIGENNLSLKILFKASLILLLLSFMGIFKIKLNL